VEEQESFFRASCACSHVHGPRKPELGLELDGALDGGYETVGEPDGGAEQWPRRT
jgi:hypothetical protein